MAQQSPRNNCVNSQEPATTARISHFFLPKRTGDRSNVTKKNATISNVTALNKSVCEELCEWGKPVGLMSEYAIEIDDGDEDRLDAVCRGMFLLPFGVHACQAEVGIERQF